MKLVFAFKHLDRSEALEAHTQQGLDHAARFLLKESQGQVLFSKRNHEFVVEISVNTHQRYFRAAASHPDPYQAVDQALTKLERQFLKIKEVVQHHKNKALSKDGKLARLNDRFESRGRTRRAA